MIIFLIKTILFHPMWGPLESKYFWELDPAEARRKDIEADEWYRNYLFHK